MSCSECTKNKHLPSLVQQARTATGAVLQAVAGEIESVSDDIYKCRLKICSNCDSLERWHKGIPKGADIGLKDRCASCGCFLRAKAKRKPKQGVTKKFWDCPLSKWDNIKENQYVSNRD